MDNFSEYFTFKELTDSTSHPEMVAQNRLDAKQYLLAGKRLSKLLESIRHILGDTPLKVNSGFRNARLNKAVGSKSTASKHTIFEAVDITPQNMSIKEAFGALMNAHRGGLLPDLRKVLYEGSWLHVEVSMNVGDHRGFFTSNDGNKTFVKVA
jgi:zinc D-Ala-D-Ala carboxypeptidase